MTADNISFDVSLQKRSYEDVTAKVERYSTENLQYPCIILRNSVKCPIEQYKVSILPKLLGSDSASERVYLYYEDIDAKKQARLGTISSTQVKSILRLFRDNDVLAYLEKDKQLVGDYIYILAV